MAIKKIIEIDVDQVQAMGGLNALEKSLQATEEKSASLKQQLREAVNEAQQLADKFGINSKEAIEASKRAADLKDRIEDTNDAIQAFKGEGAFLATSKALTSVASGATAVQGAINLLGQESEATQEAILRIQSAMALTQGLAGLEDAGRSFNQLRAVAVTSFNTIRTSAVTAFSSIKSAIATTGIGLLVIALGVLVSKLLESTDATEDQEKALNNLTEAQKRYTESLNSEIKGIENSIKIRRLRAQIAGKSEKELRDVERQGEQERADAYDAEIKRIDLELQNLKLSAEEFAFLQKEKNRLSDEALKLSQERDINQLEFEAKLADERRKAEADARQKALEDAKKKKEEEERLAKEKYENLLQEAKDFFAKAKELQEQNDKESLENLKRQQEEINALNSPEDQDINNANRRVAEIDAFQGALSEKKALLEEYNAFVVNSEFLTDQQKAFFEQQGLERKKIIQQQELAIAGDTLGKLSTLFNKNSKIGKAFAVGQALINTYQGITAELATKAVTPYEIGLKVANIAFVASTGFKAVKQILSTNPMASGGGGGQSVSSGATGGTSSAPQFNIVGQSSTNQLTATIAGQQNQPIQTYVVGSQVTSQQALDRNAQQNSVFG